MVWAAAPRQSSLRMISYSSSRATMRSMPMKATCTRGRVVAMRMLPSLETVVMWPVSAQAMLTPEVPMSAARNFSRSALRAAWVSSGGSVVRRMPSFRTKRSAISWRVLWMAGAMMCEGFSPASWMMYSPRSVSTTSIPAASSAGFKPISSVTMDLPLTTRRTRLRRATARQ